MVSAPNPEQAEPTNAWQPFTFRGVAAFAFASWGRTALVLLVAAVVVSGFVVWGLSISLVPDFETALARLPEQGAIDHGQLKWAGDFPATLSDGPFVTITISDGSTPPSLMTDWKIELRPSLLHACWFLGCADFPYPPDRVIPINKPFLDPWWGAWRPAVLWVAGLLSTLIFLLLSAVLSFVYLWPARLLAFFLDRRLTLGGAWRLSVAAVAPALLVFAAAAMSYATGTISLILLLLAVPAYVLASALYVSGALTRLPRLVPAPDNPFRPESVSSGRENLDNE